MYASVSKCVFADVPFCLPRFLSKGQNILPPWHPTELKRFHTSLIFGAPLIFTIKNMLRYLASLLDKQWTLHCIYTNTQKRVLWDLGLLGFVCNTKRNTFSEVTELVGSGGLIMWLINKSDLLDRPQKSFKWMHFK